MGAESRATFIEVTLGDIVASPVGNQFVLLFSEVGGKERTLPMPLPAQDTQRFHQALRGVELNPQYAADFLANELRRQGVQMQRLEVWNSSDGLVATCFLSSLDRSFAVDMVLLDGLYLAIRFLASIYVSQELLDAVAQDMAHFEGWVGALVQHGQRHMSSVKKKERYELLAHLEAQLKQAIIEERYEEAQKLKEDLERMRRGDV